MTGVDVIEFIQKFWLQFLLTTITGLLAWQCKKWYKALEDQKKKHACEEQAKEARSKTLEAAVLAMLHDRLIQSLVYFLKEKNITSDEFDNIRIMYEAYRDLGGNGTIKVLYARFEKYVKIVPPDYL